MNIVHLTNSINRGGAAKGVLTLHKSLVKANICSVCVAQDLPDPNDGLATACFRPRYSLALHSRLLRKYRRHRHEFLTSRMREVSRESGLLFTSDSSMSDIHEILADVPFTPELVHLHWTSNFVDSRRIITWCTKRSIPLVWTIRDNFPFTGGCHYAPECDLFMNSCRHCPYATSHVTRTLIHSAVRTRSYVLKLHRHRTSIIAMSSSSAKDCRASAVMKDMDIRHISNGINSAFLSRPSTKKPNAALSIGFVADTVHPSWKGFDRFIKVSEHFRNDLRCSFSFAGRDPGPSLRRPWIRWAGRFPDATYLKSYYDSLHFLIFCSHQDVFAKVVPEAMSRGVIVIGPRNVGCMSDLIQNRENGHLVEKISFIPDCIEILRSYLEIPTDHLAQIGAKARSTAKARCAPSAIADEYINLYYSLIHP